jgi:hypothetical protein
MCEIYVSCSGAHRSYRVLIATIRLLAECPCPRCKIKKIYVNAMGTHVDYLRRAKARVNDWYRHLSVETARKAIFKFGRVVGGQAVNAALQASSWVPTCVSHHWMYAPTFS